jgi:hypothetical protein
VAKKPSIKIPAPDIQVAFAGHLAEARRLYLQDALATTVTNLDIRKVDLELAALVPSQKLSTLAGRGLRGELLFAVPCVLQTNPRLLAYYRLLLGHSRKAFYAGANGTSSFLSMEETGMLSASTQGQLETLCTGLISSAALLMDGIGPVRISKELLDDLTLLTLGPQLRGSASVDIGTVAIERVLDVIAGLVKPYTTNREDKLVEVTNASGRRVLIELASDPDIVIREQLQPDAYRNVVAIEIKGGTDFSNIHNRLGEAEKSHQKARKKGFTECWTIVNVDRFDETKARRESPSTDRFYTIAGITSGTRAECAEFRDRILSATGIPGSDRKSARGQNHKP